MSFTLYSDITNSFITERCKLCNNSVFRYSKLQLCDVHELRHKHLQRTEKLVDLKNKRDQRTKNIVDKINISSNNNIKIKDHHQLVKK